LNEVEDLLEKALEAAERVERPAVKSSDLTAIAGVYLENGQVERCLAVLKAAVTAAERIKLPAEKAVCLVQIGGLFHSAGDASGSKEYFTRAELLAGAAETAAQQVGALFEIAREYSGSGLEKEALKVLDRLYTRVKDPQNGLDAAADLIDLAVVYNDAGRPETAAKILAEASEAAQALKDRWFRIERLTGIAEVFIILEAFSAALNSIEKVRPLLMDLAEIDRAAFWLRISEVYRLAGDKAGALEAVLAALDSVKSNIEASYQAQNLLEVAGLYFELDQRPAALTIMDLAAQKYAEVEEVRDKIALSLKQAGLLGQMGEKAQALEAAARALELSRTVSNPKEKLYWLGSLAAVYAVLGESKKVAETVLLLCGIAMETRAKTTGLGVIAGELSEAGEPQAAIRLAELVSEPHARAECLAWIAGSLIDSQPESTPG
jgi:tetratricopeptide (TPR) repeat protein